MRLSTTTLGCPTWDLSTVLSRLGQYGFDGVDFRGLQCESRLWVLPEFSSRLTETAARIRDSGLAVTCISSSIHLCATAPEEVAAYDEELLRSAEICQALACPQIRVWGGALALADGASEDQRDRVVDRVAERVSALADRARGMAPVDLLIETHDAWSSSPHVRTLLDRVARDDVACCWDIKHTYWLGQETPETTWGNLGAWIRNTHWKDVRRFRGSSKGFTRDDIGKTGLLCLPGEGILPLSDCCDLLAASGYDGWYTLEWEKRWHPHIEEPDIAFPRFVAFMRAWASDIGHAETTGTGNACVDAGERL